MRLLVVEDEVDFALALLRGLRQQGYAVDWAEDGEQGWELAEINDYDLVILDLNLPKLDGLVVCQRLRARQLQVLILMLTARDRPEDRIIGLDVGADDYLIKPFHFGELLARLRALLRRDARTRQPVLHYRDLTLDPAAQTAWHRMQRLELTRKKFGILCYLLHHQGEVISQEMLLEHVWDVTANPFTNTVRVHINALRRRLGDLVEPYEYIQTVVGGGYRLGDWPAQEPPI